MHFLILFFICQTVFADNETDEFQNSVNDVADALIVLLGYPEGGNDTQRIKELKEKRNKVLQYTIDKDKYVEALLQHARSTNLNLTNFYNALNHIDHFHVLANESKNLYLKLKERMNRDDVLNILANNGRQSMMKSARRMMQSGFRPKRLQDKEMEDVVDKIIAEVPNDGHRFNEEDNFNKYWDPEIELRERQEYHRHDGRRLFKGERTTIRYHPYMASVHVMGRFWCGGAIYWYDMVITSAACLQLMHNNRFFRENPKVLAVRVGSNHSRIGGEMVDTLEVFFHPSYNPKTLRNNIALIRLKRLLRLSYHRLPKLISIVHGPFSMPLNGEVLVLGWGVTKTSQKLAYEPIYLHRKLLPIYPNQFCKEVYGDMFVQKSMFCAGTLTTGEGACDHDAGGPAVRDGKLVGIISYGPTICGYPNTPTVFTDIGAYADWIESVNESFPQSYRGKARTTTTTKEPMLRFSTDAFTPLMRVEKITLRMLVTDKPTEPLTRFPKKITTPVTTTTEDTDAELRTATTTAPTPMSAPAMRGRKQKSRTPKGFRVLKTSKGINIVDSD